MTHDMLELYLVKNTYFNVITLYEFSFSSMFVNEYGELHFMRKYL